MISRTLIASGARAMAEGALPPLVAKLSKNDWANLARECPAALWRENGHVCVRLMAAQDAVTPEGGPQYVALGAEFDIGTELGTATITDKSGALVAEVQL